MRSKIAIAALIGVAFGAASASSAFAQSSAPGPTPPRNGKIASLPTPPPPPRGTYATPTQPPKPGMGPRSVPTLGFWPSPAPPQPIDDIAEQPHGTQAGQGGSTCYPAAGPNCVASLDAMCTKKGGGMRTNEDGSVTCVVN